jgi:hypothetical protein
MAMNTKKIAKSFRSQTGGFVFVPCRSAPAHR